ncbi:18131_t:CDS:2 [Gigaspora rosea]|nr:18131_t:CDS:2 [Gigaspora rosea]
MPRPKPKSHIASSKPRTETGTFAIQFQVPENTEEFVEAPDDWKLFEVTDEDFQNYALKAIEWHQEADKKIKSAFYTEEKKSRKQLQKEAKNMKTLNEMWDTVARNKKTCTTPKESSLLYRENITIQSQRQKQLMEERYNKLKKQFRGLQNTKNQMAKSQPYDVQREKKMEASKEVAEIFWKGIRNTQHMACCLRRWTKDYLIQGSLPSQQQVKHAKRISLLDDEDIKLAACRWLRSILPKDCSPLALKNELEKTIFPKLLGVPITISDQTVYFDGHERDDIKKYRIEWALRMVNYQKSMEDYSGDEMEIIILPEQRDSRYVLVTHDEVYFYTNNNNSFFWVEDNESFINKKGQGSAIMVRDFMCACHGPLRLTEADAK